MYIPVSVDLCVLSLSDSICTSFKLLGFLHKLYVQVKCKKLHTFFKIMILSKEQQRKL